MTPRRDDESGSDLPRFTPRQGQYLAFIWAYAQINGKPPAEADFERYFRVTAPSVHQMLRTLHRLGLIHKPPRVPRGIRLLVPPQDLPILGQPHTQPVTSSVQRN